jgi:chemotaxis protein CheD
MAREYLVEVATYRVARNPIKLTCLGLGSCLGIALFESRLKIGGLAHAMLPRFEKGRYKNIPSRYVDTSIYLMIDEIIEQGGKKFNIIAKLVGGAQMFSPSDNEILEIGSRNIKTAYNILEKERIKIKGEDIGGNQGRTMTFDLKTGKIRIRTTGKQINNI